MESGPPIPRKILDLYTMEKEVTVYKLFHHLDQSNREMLANLIKPEIPVFAYLFAWTQK